MPRGRPPIKQPKPPITDEARATAVRILLTDTIRRHTQSLVWTPETLSAMLMDKYIITGPKIGPKFRSKQG